MVAQLADVHLRFLRQQLFIGLNSLPSTPPPPPVPRPGWKAISQHLITTPIIQDILCHLRNAFYCTRLMCPYLQWMDVTITQS